MKTIKIAEATPLQIDYLAAKCENALWLAYDNALNNETPIPPRPSEYLCDYEFHPDYFKPSTDPAQGLPILEREKIGVGHAWDSDDWLASAHDISAPVYHGPPLSSQPCDATSPASSATWSMCRRN